jgi:hypothetical protein
VRFCEATCPSATADDAWASRLDAALLKFASLHTQWSESDICKRVDLATELDGLCADFEYCCADCTCGTKPCDDLSKCTNCYHLLRTLSACYSGLRSLRRRYIDIQRNATWLHLYQQAVDQLDLDTLQRLARGADLSKSIRTSLAAKHAKSASRVHSQANVEARYGDLIEASRDRIREKILNTVCNICNRLRYKAHVVVESASHAAPQIAKTSLVSMQRVSVVYFPIFLT